MSDCMNCGEYCGHSHGDLSTEMILLDLIADLRDHCREPSCGCDIGKAASHAESQLRILRDD